MACTCSWKAWIGVTVLTILEVVIDIISAIAWGAGLAQKIISMLVDPHVCFGFCLDTARGNVQNLQLTAAILYGFCALFGCLAVVGLLSGVVALQIPNVVASLLKIALTIVLCETLLDIDQGTDIYNVNRAFMYACTVSNMLTFMINIFQTKAEYDREQAEKSGRIPVEIRPLTNCLRPHFINCTWCSCCNSTDTAPEVCSNEIRVPMDQDSPDGVKSQAGPHDAGRDSVDGNAESPHVVDMGEENAADDENLNESVRSEAGNLKDSNASRQSSAGEPSAADELRKRKSTRSSESGESDDEVSQEGEFNDEEPLVDEQR